jgi:REP element-mobilizing transposase RayT
MKPKARASRGWYRRGYLPHLEVVGRATGITFRLADSLPRKVVERWRREMEQMPEKEMAVELARKVAAYEDAGRGCCCLLRPACAALVEETLLCFSGERYQLLEWCVMPNHVHVLVQLGRGQSFETVVRSWKNFTARRINELEGRRGRLWAPDFFDRMIRDESHLARARRYVRMNPVKAALCETSDQWRWSSAWAGRRD